MLRRIKQIIILYRGKFSRYANFTKSLKQDLSIYLFAIDSVRQLPFITPYFLHNYYYFGGENIGRKICKNFIPRKFFPIMVYINIRTCSERFFERTYT